MKFFKLVIPLLLFAGSIALYAQPAPEEDEGKNEAKEALEELKNAGSEAKDSEEGAEEILSDMESLEEEAETVEENLEETDDQLIRVRKGMNELRRAAEDINDGAQVLSEIPEAQPIAESIEALTQTVTELQATVQQLRRDIQRSEREAHSGMKKVREVFEAMLLGKAIYEIGGMFHLWKMPEENSDSEAKVSLTMTKGDYKCLGNKLRNFTGEYKTLLQAENNMLRTVKEPMKKLSAIIPEIKTVSNDMEKLLKPVDKFMKHIKPLKKALRDMHKILNKKVSFKYHLKVMGIKHTFHIHIVSVKDAMRGVEHIEKRLEESLLKPELKALKKFGMRKVAHEIRKLAEHPFKEAMNLVKPELKKIHIPGVSGIEKELKKTKEKFEAMNSHLKAIIHVGIPDIDVDKYKDIKSRGIKHFTSQCGF